MTKVYTGDTGTVITLDCGQDISAATLLTIEVRKPDGTLVSWTGALSGTNFIRFVSLAETFDQAGTWRMQALVTMASGVWRGETASFIVYPNFG